MTSIRNQLKSLTTLNSDTLICLPRNAGRSIIEAGAVVASPLLSSGKFVTYCTERGVSVTQERLLRLERLGLFEPVFRVKTPIKDTAPFHIPIRKGNNWFTKRWAWDCTGIARPRNVPSATDRSQEGYYSVFQIDFLDVVLSEMSIDLQMDSYLDLLDPENIDWKEKGTRWLQWAAELQESSRKHEYRRSRALLCQYISNRYFFKTQTDQRTILLSKSSYFDDWISVVSHDWDWYAEARTWDPNSAARLFRLTPKKLRHAYEDLATQQSYLDPLASWHDLVQFVSVEQRNKLKKDALMAGTLLTGAHMLRHLYSDLYGEELPEPNEVSGTRIIHVPELDVRKDARRHLEFVANRFGVNPQPKLLLILEGKSEEAVLHQIFNKYYGAHAGTYGIESMVIGGVGNATGSKKEDRFRAILRLIDYLHHHQTYVFLILDNENYASKLKVEARKAKSIHTDKRFITRPEYIKIWKDSFEFDNFSSSELASAMSKVSEGRCKFLVPQIVACRATDNPGASLTKLYKSLTNYELPKIKLNEILVDAAISVKSKRKFEGRPIVRVLDRVLQLAALNHFPTMQESWEWNQESKHLGKKTQKSRKRNLKLRLRKRNSRAAS